MRWVSLVVIGVLIPLTAHADFWSDDTGRLNERLNDFNHTFELKTRGEIDRASFEKAGHAGNSPYFTDSTHWPSYLCGASVLQTISQNYYTTYYGKPSSVRLGLKKVKTIRCAAGTEKNVTLAGDTLTIILDKTSGENDPPMVAAAMLHAFPELAWDGAEESIKDSVDRVTKSCGIAATFSFDKPHVNAVSYFEHTQTAANACADVLNIFISGCEHNPGGQGCGPEGHLVRVHARPRASGTRRPEGRFGYRHGLQAGAVRDRR